MIIICMDAHQRVITDCMTMCGNISVAYVWQSEYVLQYVLQPQIRKSWDSMENANIKKKVVISKFTLTCISLQTI